LIVVCALGGAVAGCDGAPNEGAASATTGAGPGGQGGATASSTQASGGATASTGGAPASGGGGAGGAGGICGNLIVEPGEQCDGEPGCADDCTWIPDEDKDGISDADEGKAAGTDTDADGTPDYQDTDSDGDGIPDAVEAGDADIETPPIDTDKDGQPDFQDTDADGDGIPDKVEAGPTPSMPVDTDGDYLPDYVDLDSDNDDLPDAVELMAGTDPLDPDSDGDTISDGDEGIKDADGDTIINALDLDSDGDGKPDAVEAGDADWKTLPVDTDLDGIDDFLDLDSEQDGLPDALEVDCKPTWLDGRVWPDADFDGYPDLVEVLVGSNPCDPTKGPKEAGIEFFFILPFNGAEQKDVLRFDPAVQKADVFFNIDQTGSMGGEASSLKAGIATIIGATKARVSDAGFGVAQFDDFPVQPFGGPGGAASCSNTTGPNDAPWILHGGVTTDTAAATANVNKLTLHCGEDFPEAGYEALYQVAVGSGVTGTAGSWGPWAQAGTIGGARFRTGSLPIPVHITDAIAHDATCPPNLGPYGGWTTDYPASFNDHSKAQALAELVKIGARVITVQSLWAGSIPDGDQIDAGLSPVMQEISQTTKARVPVCAFKTGATSWRCGADTCCDGTLKVGTDCVLRYTIAADGSGLTSAIVDGIDGIVKYTTFDVYNKARDDGNAATPDTSLFLKKIESIVPDDSFKPPNEPERSCTPVPVPTKLDGVVTHNNAFKGFAPGKSLVTVEGAKLFFNVFVQNTTEPEGKTPQLFTAYIDIIDDLTKAVLDTQDVVIIVPAAPGGAGDQ
jgi:hypothetical protein